MMCFQNLGSANKLLAQIYFYLTTIWLAMFQQQQVQGEGGVGGDPSAAPVPPTLEDLGRVLPVLRSVVFKYLCDAIDVPCRVCYVGPCAAAAVDGQRVARHRGS